MDGQNKKKQIFYAREYRHMKKPFFLNVLEICWMTVPFLLILQKYYSRLSMFLSTIVQEILAELFGADAAIAQNDTLTALGPVFYVDLDGRKPGFTMCLILFAAVLFLFIIILQIFEKYKSFMVYFGILCGMFLVSDLYFIFWGDKFPYTLGGYANIYLVQQAVIWASVALVTAVALSILPGIHGSATLSFWATMVYSVIYGCMRYIVFTVFLYWATNVFMAPMYFLFGVFLDFMYVVAIYAFYAKRISEKFNQRKELGAWEWL